MLRILAIAASAVSFAAVSGLLAGAAMSQDFSGDCTKYKASKDTCTAQQWCRWLDKKPVVLPNGQTFQPAGVCQFKPGFKQGYQATAQK